MDKYKLLQYLRNNPEKLNTVSLICRKFDVKPSKVRYLIQQLEHMKLVDRRKELILGTNGIKRPTSVYFAVQAATQSSGRINNFDAPPHK